MTSRCTMLLVEDNPDDVELTRLAFEDSRLCNDLVVAEDGEQALDYLFGTGRYEGRDMNDMPVVVLLDLKLPKISGLEVLQRIRADERTNYLPVIVLTSSKEEEDVIKSYKRGANAYVRKPVDYDQFVEAAKTLGLFWLVLNEPPPPGRARP